MIIQIPWTAIDGFKAVGQGDRQPG